MSHEKLVFLRNLKLQDMDLRTRWINDYDVNSMLVIESPISLEDSQAWFNRISKDNCRIDYMICKAEDSLPIGIIGLTGISTIHHHAELYIYIGEKKEWGKGFGVAALEQAMQYAEDELHLNKIYLHTLENNVKAIKLYEKYGFKLEGKLERHVVKGGGFASLNIHSFFFQNK